MPVVPTIQGQQVQPEALQVNTRLVHPEAFGEGVSQANMGIGREFQNYGQSMANNAIKMQTEQDNTNVLNAHSAMVKDVQGLMYDQNNGLMTRMGVGANGIYDQYNDQTNKIKQKYLLQMQGPNMQKEFTQLADHTTNLLGSQIAAHQAQQTRIGNITTFHDGVDTLAGMSNLAPGVTSLTALQSQLFNPDYMQKGSIAYGGIGTDQIKKELVKSFSASALTQADTLIDNGDWQSAKQIYDTFKSKITPAAATHILGMVSKKQNEDTNSRTADEIVKSSIRSDGSIDRGMAKSILDTKLGIGSVKSVPGNGSFNSGIDNFTNSIVGIESGGNYNAEGPVQDDGDYAIGKYQIMKSNWSNWAKESGLPADAPTTPQNQDTIYKNKMHEYYNTYGGDWGKMAIAWHAGPDRVDYSDEQLANISDGNMTTLQYKNNVLGNLSQGTTTSNFDATKYKAVESIVNSRITDMERIKNEKDQEYKKNLSQQIDTVGSLEEAQTIIKNSSLPLETRNQLNSAVNTKFKALSKGDATPEQFFWSKYEKSGLYTDLKSTQEFSDKISAGEDIDEKDTLKNDIRLGRLNKYYKFSSGGGYGTQSQEPQIPENHNPEHRTGPQSQANVEAWIDQMRMQGYSSDAIKQSLHTDYGEQYDSWVW